MSSSSTLVPVSRKNTLLPTDGDVSNDSTMGVLCFVLGGEEFAVDLDLVSQIVQPPPITLVPRTKSYFTGVITVRGGVVTVVDFRQLLGREPLEDVSTARILLYDTPNELFGLLVDNVTLVKRIPLDVFEANPMLEENPATDKVIGVIRLESHAQIAVIDLKEIMNEAVK